MTLDEVREWLREHFDEHHEDAREVTICLAALDEVEAWRGHEVVTSMLRPTWIVDGARRDLAKARAALDAALRGDSQASKDPTP